MFGRIFYSLFTVLVSIFLFACNNDNSVDGDLTESEVSDLENEVSEDGDLDSETETANEDEIETDLEAEASNEIEAEDELETELEDENETYDGFTVLKYAEYYCPWQSACIGNYALLNCMDYILSDNDGPIFYGTFEKDHTEDTYNCLKNVSNCIGFFACITNNATYEKCDNNNYVPTCNGNTLTYCSLDKYGSMVSKINCEDKGMICVSDSEGAICELENHSCINNEPYCDGQHQISCYGDLLHSQKVYNCSDLGFECNNGICTENGAPDCDGLPVCDGDYYVNCYQDKKQTYDCRSVNPDFTCSSTTFGADLGMIECLPPQDKWECSAHQMTCEGNIANVCSAGKLFKFDCSKYDGASCTSNGCETLNKNK